MLRTTKPNRCEHCKERMPEDKARHVLHDECKDAWIAATIAKQQAAKLKEGKVKARLDRADTRKRKAALKTLNDHKADAQKVRNRYVLLRDAGMPCISCGTTTAQVYQAGHYRTRGSSPHLALDLRNINRQCVQCNLHLHGNPIGYRQGLVERFGVQFVEELEADQAPRHYSADDFKALQIEDREMIRQLQRTTA